MTVDMRERVKADSPDHGSWHPRQGALNIPQATAAITPFASRSQPPTSMAPESQGKGGDPETPQKQRRASRDNSQESRSSTEDEDDDEEEEEPRLNYATLTRNQGPLYRNGDAVSAFLVGGDKMVGLSDCRL